MDFHKSLCMQFLLHFQHRNKTQNDEQLKIEFSQNQER